MHNAVLEIANLTVYRERRELLSDVSLSAGQGSVHLLVGPNGAGKSTLFAAVLGLVEFSGTIRFNWQGGGRIGHLPQSFAVDRTLPLTVAEFLALSRQRRPVCVGVARRTRRRIEALLAQVGLAGFATRPLGALSGGELQRVLLANAIDPAPELLLLDEPASGLDETALRQFEAVLLSLTRDAGTAALMVSHDLAQVRRVADQVTLIDRVVRRSGSPAAVLADNLAASFALDAGAVTS
jgi:zinc transport system ATP-binding protein